MRVLVVNVGSSSLKLSVLDDEEVVAAQETSAAERDNWHGQLERFVTRNKPVDAVGHRIVHGGTEFTGAVRVDDGVRRRLEGLVDLAPLHLPGALRALDRVRALLPDVPVVACFDTAFHAHLPPAASTYAIPEEWRRRWPLRRFGFHGLSHAWASHRAADLMSVAVETIRVVTCHLGSGASLTAVRYGESVDTTMGFTPLEGLVMASRSGSVDPGLLLWLEQHGHVPVVDIASALEERSGLRGLAGTSDMRSVLQKEAAGDAAAALAVSVYLHRLGGGIAAMAAAMGGLDALVFTGGVGEHAASIRLRAVEGLGFMGIGMDREVNRAATPDAEVSLQRGGVRTFVVRAREDIQMSREVRRTVHCESAG